DSPGEQRLAVAWRAVEEDTPRDTRPEPAVALGGAQEVDHLEELAFRLIAAGHVVERDRSHGRRPFHGRRHDRLGWRPRWCRWSERLERVRVAGLRLLTEALRPADEEHQA